MRPVVIPDALISQFVEVWNRMCHFEVDPGWINSGWCYQFALVMKKVYGKRCQLYTDLDGGHCWVKIGRRYYDSDHQDGTLEPLSMGYQDNWIGPVTIKKVEQVWKNGGSGPINWDVIKTTVKEFKRNNSKRRSA